MILDSLWTVYNLSILPSEVATSDKGRILSTSCNMKERMEISLIEFLFMYEIGYALYDIIKQTDELFDIAIIQAFLNLLIWYWNICHQLI